MHFILGEKKRPFSCNICKRAFYQERGLKLHISKIHSCKFVYKIICTYIQGGVQKLPILAKDLNTKSLFCSSITTLRNV